ncbi:MAG: hypothetical protein JJ896_17695 [Rhodothermales bacterium]|nr:hypothetical protein [Rhodothermales bacterium]MBO6781496.1 hypothetical protein [Rhodothermales bacterium]
MPDTPRTRFAPTPSGYLHLGNVFNLLLAEAWRAETGGEILLRIDDLDRSRFRPEYLQDVFRVADWLGIAFELGPADPMEFAAHWSQSLRAPRYLRALQPLVESGEVFACTCSRREIAERSPDGTYPGTCRDKRIALDTFDAALRFRLDAREVRGQPDSAFQDPVVRRKDGTVAYHVASVVDDVDYGITHIIRGMDLEPSSRLQRVVARAMGLRSFLEVEIHHHPLLAARDGSKLSKSAGSAARSLLEGDRSADEVRALFASWLSST